jgi:L-threonylcarbamoyladenylate synthase
MFQGEGFGPERAASHHVSLPADAPAAAALLYDTLFRLDRAGLDLILIEMPPDAPDWAAIRDRLMRAAADVHFSAPQPR